MPGKIFKLLLPCLLLAAMLCNMLPTAVFASGEEGSLSTVYLDGTNGLDTNDGTTAGTAVQTFAEAKRLLSTTDGTIHVTGLVTISGTESWSLDGYTNAVIKRDTSLSDNYLIQVVSGGSLTLSNITLDGNKESITSTKSLIDIYGGSLTMNNGAVLQNNSCSIGGGAIVLEYNTNKILTMNGGKITDNDATGNGGGVYFGKGSFIMKGGEIPIKPPQETGEVYLHKVPQPSIVNFEINGGIITGNTAAIGSAILSQR